MTTSTNPHIVIAGRPNVGKSTLFNLLAPGNRALVDATPGVTRDTRQAKAVIGSQMVNLVDTAGLESSPDSLAQRLNTLAEAALAQADVILFVVDGRVGVLPEDEIIARKLHRAGRPTLLLVNKMDTGAQEDDLAVFLSLGFSDVYSISSAHNRGLGEVTEAIATMLPPVEEDISIATTEIDMADSEHNAEDEDAQPDRPLKLAIVGRPNAGKSTLVNALLASERMLTGPEAGLTRESLGTLWEHDGRLIELVDTPGLRRKARITEALEKMSVGSALEAIATAEAVILVLDATCPFEKQDIQLAAHAVDEGKPVVVALNKWDLIADKPALLDEVRYLLETRFYQVKNVPLVPISALKGKGLDALLPAVIRLHELWSRRIGTGELNRFLEAALEHNPPPMRKGRRIKIKYMSQVGARPPTFALWCNLPKDLPESYLRYMSGALREAFELDGIVLRLRPRGGKNPYVK